MIQFKHLSCSHGAFENNVFCAVCISRKALAQRNYEAEKRMVKNQTFPARDAQSVIFDDAMAKLDEAVVQRDQARKVGMSPALAAPYGDHSEDIKRLGLPDAYYDKVREELYGIDNHFADALAYRLAHDLAENIIEQGRDADRKLELWKYLLMLAGATALIYLITYFASYIELGGIK